MPNLAQALIDLVPADGRAWLDRGMTTPFDRNRFAATYAGAGRRLGDGATNIGALELSPGLPTWPAHHVGRAGLLLWVTETLSADEAFDVVDDTFYRGDNREREALLRVLAALPTAERYRPLAIEACRTNVQSVFVALACHNPFGARHFDDDAFNQMVLKATMLGLPLDRIVELEARRNAELFRMAGDYAAERRAANRALPPDINLILEADRS